MKVETDYEKVDWRGVEEDFRVTLFRLKTIWRATQEQAEPSLHAQMVRDLYLPALAKVAEFVTCVQVMEEDDGED